MLYLDQGIVEHNRCDLTETHRVDGSWMIVELGDAQVAGLPERLDATAFYAALSRHARSNAGAAP